jgi:hypothetical protein
VSRNVSDGSLEIVLFQFNISIYVTDIPTTSALREEYKNSLEKAVKTVLNVSADWSVQVSEEFSDFKRGFPPFARICFVFSTSLVAVMEARAMGSKATSKAFFDQLKVLGFAVSAERPQSGTPSDSGTSMLIQVL